MIKYLASGECHVAAAAVEVAVPLPCVVGMQSGDLVGVVGDGVGREVERPVLLPVGLRFGAREHDLREGQSENGGTGERRGDRGV